VTSAFTQPPDENVPCEIDFGSVKTLSPRVILVYFVCASYALFLSHPRTVDDNLMILRCLERF
jgi:hypothetical protein